MFDLAGICCNQKYVQSASHCSVGGGLTESYIRKDTFQAALRHINNIGVLRRDQAPAFVQKSSFSQIFGESWNENLFVCQN